MREPTGSQLMSALLASGLIINATPSEWGASASACPSYSSVSPDDSLSCPDCSHLVSLNPNRQYPDYICPLLLTSATQEMFGCQADKDVTGENPYKLLRKDDIIEDMRKRAAVSDFSPIKQLVLDYPEDEILLVYDQDFTYDQCFYLVLSLEVQQNLLMPPDVTEEEDEEDEEELKKTPEPRCWVSLGSEEEIKEESTIDTRSSFCYKISRLRREFGAPVHFSDLSAMTEGAYTEFTSYQDKSFSIKKLEQDCGIQAIANIKDASSQTIWRYPKNMWTQYEPPELNEEEKQNILQLESLRNCLSVNMARFEFAILQNNMLNVFADKICVPEEDSMYEGKAETQLQVYQTFTELHYSKEKVITCINWHPTIKGVVAVSVKEDLSFEKRIDNFTKLLLYPRMIIFWSFSDSINPQLLLECPDDVLCFNFCPSDTNIIVGGCMNGQVVLWDISGHVDRLQGTRAGVQTKMTNTVFFDDKQENDIPVVRYCALAGIGTGHRGPVTDVQWLPDSYEVSGLGIPLKNTHQISVQIVTCSSDGCVMFWDLRAPLTGKKPRVEEKTLENTYGVPKTFKHLNLTWKPLFRVTLPKVDGPGQYSPMKFSLADSVCYTPAVERSEVPAFSVLKVPSGKKLDELDTINTKFYVGTEDGQLVYTDWRMEMDKDTGQPSSPKPTHIFEIHDSQLNTVLRSPFFKDIILTVGGWTFAIWKEGVMNGPLLHSARSWNMRTAGFWSLTRPAVFFIGKENGSLEVWNLLEKTHEPVLKQKITTTPISCIKPWITSSKKQLLAVSDHLGTLHILEVPWTLHYPASNEVQNMSSYLEREVKRLIYFEKMSETQEKEKKVMKEENNETPKRIVFGDDTWPKLSDNEMEELKKKVQKDYEKYFTLEERLMQELGLVKETQDKDNT
ncbi:dynein axonemal intermediate chain 3 [Neoarius graeffei]|uniref:dynein axonemal intermediate chain 3 n=1 Tax=Neoarius graeffei TaxID=443677 RepID=UPI00298C894C|nr:dynein axonemal intermediate chain 3 [Neoarius graeffei]